MRFVKKSQNWILACGSKRQQSKDGAKMESRGGTGLRKICLDPQTCETWEKVWLISVPQIWVGSSLVVQLHPSKDVH